MLERNSSEPLSTVRLSLRRCSWNSHHSITVAAISTTKCLPDRIKSVYGQQFIYDLTESTLFLKNSSMSHNRPANCIQIRHKVQKTRAYVKYGFQYVDLNWAHNCATVLCEDLAQRIYINRPRNTEITGRNLTTSLSNINSTLCRLGIPHRVPRDPLTSRSVNETPAGYFRLPPRCKWDLRSSGMLRSVEW